MNEKADNLVTVFSDVNGHLEIAGIIRDHLHDKRDVREIALEGNDLSPVKDILDLGCGYGFFTRGLKGKVHEEATVTGVDKYEQNRSFYLNACMESGIKGIFLPDGADVIREMADNHFDLVICSYALYFFPDHIRYIARILKENGLFVAITHSRPHMHEFTEMVRSILESRYNGLPENLPYSQLIKNFSNENGYELLSTWFGEVSMKEYKNVLEFDIDDFESFEKYFRYKRSFFIPWSNGEDNYTGIVLDEIRKIISGSGQLRITKDDMIFVCRHPRKVL